MSFRYFAYGSNLWPPRMRSRCPSARVVRTATLDGWSLVCDKPSVDGSAKINIRPHPEEEVAGVVYEIDDTEREALDAAEPLYTPTFVDVDGLATLTYIYEGDPHSSGPYDWYLAVTSLGATTHGLPDIHVAAPSVPDPMAPGIRPATSDDLDVIQVILSDGLSADTERYYIHPGDIAWWVYHDDPRYPHHFSMWLQAEDAFAVVNTLQPQEISVFARPGVDRMPLIRWSQRWLGGNGDVGWVADSDTEIVSDLKADGYQPVFSNREYEWDLANGPAEPNLPRGWVLRSLQGEAEAESRRAAAHAAFESTMDPKQHLQRYLEFMRSPVYVPERDLVAVAPDGTIASFMIWWGDESDIAEIEPFGTHPDYQRKGIGRALLYYGLAQMRQTGMRRARVCTPADSPATDFYESCGFIDAGRLRWWRPPAKTEVKPSTTR